MYMNNKSNKNIKKVANDLEIHRYRNGRLELEYFSRQQLPRYSLIKLDDSYYGLNSLRTYLKERNTTVVPKTRRRLTKDELAVVFNRNPYRILGKAPVYPSNKA